MLMLLSFVFVDLEKVHSGMGFFFENGQFDLQSTADLVSLKAGIDDCFLELCDC